MSDADFLVPAGSRPGARILLFDAENRLLLFRVRNPSPEEIFWITPGGGLEPGESFPEAAKRELREETGLDAEIGQCVWFREHHYAWNGRPFHLYERFFLARTTAADIQPLQPDDYFLDSRWWTLDEIEASSEIFAPRQLKLFVRELLRGAAPQSPIDVGV